MKRPDDQMNGGRPVAQHAMSAPQSRALFVVQGEEDGVAQRRRAAERSRSGEEVHSANLSCIGLHSASLRLCASQCFRLRRGFTLIELTLALAIVAMVAVPLSAVLSVAFRAKASAERAVEPARTAQIIMEYLRADIQNAVPPTGTLATSFEGATSGNGADDLTFFTTADSPEHDNANGEIKQVELTIAPPATGGEAVLLRRVNRNLLYTYTPVPDEEVLARNVAGLSFRFFDGTEWLPNWDSTQEQNELPCAVEVTLDLQRPAGTNDQHTLHFVRVFQISSSTVSSFSPATGLGGLGG